MGTLFAILLLLALCGFIAYIGDLLGRRLGKKRLSVFGLRPKHTAILLTIVTGVLIAAVTFGAAFLSMPWFQTVVTKGERLATLNRRLRDRNRELQSQNAGQVEQNLQLSQQNEGLQSANAGLRAENGRLSGTNRELTRKNRVLGDRSRQLETRNASLLKQTEQLQQGNRSLETKNAGLVKANGDLTRQSGQLQLQNTRLQATNRDLQARNTGLAARANYLDTRVAHLSLIANRYKQEDYIFRRGQQIARRPVPLNPPLDVLRNQVRFVLFDAERSIKERHATLAFADPSGRQRPTALDSATAQALLVSQISRVQDTPIVIRVVAEENCVAGQPVPIRLDWYANETVFRKGEVISWCTVDGHDDEGLIMGDLLRLLQSGVRQKATSPPYQMVPTDESIGEAPWGELIRVCREVKQLDTALAVVARARQNTLRSGPLSVDLEVRRLDERIVGLR